jgi:hypothetical protein
VINLADRQSRLPLAALGADAALIALAVIAATSSNDRTPLAHLGAARWCCSRRFPVRHTGLLRG